MKTKADHSIDDAATKKQRTEDGSIPTATANQPQNKGGQNTDFGILILLQIILFPNMQWDELHKFLLEI